VTITSADGTDVVVAQEGSGPVVLIVHGGLSDESPWAKVAAALAPSFRVLRLRRRLYRTERPSDPATDYAREVEDIAAVTATIAKPCLLVGHSSGAVVALEALLAHPEAFAGAVLYEPPVVLEGQVGEPTTVARARAALAADRPGRALRIFLAECVRVPAALALLVGVATRFNADLRRFAGRQIDDTEAIDRLGRRIEAYAAIQTPTLFVSGDKSPAHLGERTRILAAAMPDARIERLKGLGHDANDRDPALVATLIIDWARAVGLT